jgi:hypothetical protein
VKKLLLIVLAVAVAEVAGGTAGGFIGVALGDLGGRIDPENVWVGSILVGAAVGLLLALAVLLVLRLVWGRKVEDE